MQLGQEEMVDLKLSITLQFSTYEVLERMAANCGVSLGVLLSSLIDGAAEGIGHGHS